MTATFREAQSAAALAIADEQYATRRKVEEILHLGRGDGHVNHILEMGDESYVVEMTGGPFSENRDATYRVIVEGKKNSIVFLDLDHALLALVMGRHNGGNLHDNAFAYAARVLNVPEMDEV